MLTEGLNFFAAQPEQYCKDIKALRHFYGKLRGCAASPLYPTSLVARFSTFDETCRNCYRLIMSLSKDVIKARQQGRSLTA